MLARCRRESTAGAAWRRSVAHRAGAERDGARRARCGGPPGPA